MILSMQLNYFDQCLNNRCSEAELIELARLGDLDAFNDLALQYQDLLFRVAYRIMADEDSAQDAVQDGLISAFQHIQSFRDGSLKGWLIRIVVNKCGDQLRAARYRRAISLDAPLSASPEEDSDLYMEVKDTGMLVEDCVERYQFDRALQQCLNTLPLKSRSILILADIEELEYEEIASMLHIPMGTVKSRLARARLKLRGLLLSQDGLLPEKYRQLT